jgi:hypothetical protein
LQNSDVPANTMLSAVHSHHIKPTFNICNVR